MRKSLALATMCALSLAACNKDGGGTGQQGLVNWKSAPPLLAGEDTGATPVGPPPPAPKVDGTPIAAGDTPMRKAGVWLLTTTTTSTGGNRGGGGGQRGPGGGANGGGANGGGGQRGGGANGGGGGNFAGGGGANGGGRGGPGGPGRGPQGPIKLCVTPDSEHQRSIFASNGRGTGATCDPKIAKTAGGYNAASACNADFGGNTVLQTTKITVTGDLDKRYSLTSIRSSTGGPNGDTTTTTHTTGVYQGPCPADQKGGDEVLPDGTKRNIFDQPAGGRRGGGGGGGNRGGN